MSEKQPNPSRITETLVRNFCPPGQSVFSIGQYPATDLLEEFGSPLYVYDAGILRRNFKAVRKAVGERLQILYALKANPNIAIAQIFRKQGSGAEVASAGEIHAALAAGFDGPAIQFAGPGKSSAEMELGIEIGLGSFNLESPAEYREIATVSRRLGKKSQVSIRVNPMEATSGARMLMSGAGKKFGVDADRVAPLIRDIMDDQAVTLRGLHTYYGTQFFDADGWVKHAKWLVDFAGELERTTGQPIEMLNFGGGFGVAYYEGDPAFDLKKAGQGLRRLIAADNRPERSYHIELGRYLVATAGVYLSRVSYIKESGGQKHAILDGGLHHHSAAAGFGSIMRRNYPMVNCNRIEGTSADTITLGGPLCTPADEIASDVPLSDLKRGDAVAVLASGAYGLTFSNVLFLSHPMPAEVLVDLDSASLVRERGDEKDPLRGQRLP